MGLSGRKLKQRIPTDPRNLSWANDANKFGSSYLQKFGWDAGQGLGAEGEGRKTHLSVHQKLDMLGIGADHRNSADGTAWKQGREYETLLRRLNAAGNAVEEVEEMRVSGFIRPGKEVGGVEEGSEEEVSVEAEVVKEKKKSKTKRKHEETGEGEGDEGKDKKKRKKSKSEDKEERRKEKKEKKKRKAEALEVQSVATEQSTTAETSTASVITTVQKSVTVIARPVRAHRARHMAAKGLASKSSAAIAEILGISSSTPSLLPSSAPSPDPSATPVTPVAEPSLEKLSTSSKSVMDYFREKLAAKSRPASTPALPAAAERDAWDGYEARPRGLGMGVGSGFGMGIGAARRMEMAFTPGASTSEKPDEGADMSKPSRGEEAMHAAEEVEVKNDKKKKDKKGKAKDVSSDADAKERAPPAEDRDALGDTAEDTVKAEDKEKKKEKGKKEKRRKGEVVEDAQEGGKAKKSKRKRESE